MTQVGTGSAEAARPEVPLPQADAAPLSPKATVPADISALSGAGAGTAWWALRELPAAERELPAVEPAPLASRRQVSVPVLLAAITASALLAGVLGGGVGYAAAYGMSVFGGGVPLAAQRAPGSQAAVVRQVLPSVVTIRVNDGDATSVGSGFVISADGYLVTNEHVVAEATTPVEVVFSDGTEHQGRLVGRAAEADLAVLKVEDAPPLPAVRFGDSDAIAVGDPVLAFGSPLALNNTVTAGIVSALERPLKTGGGGDQVRYYAAIQTDAAVNQGNSGGPLIDAAGRVIGVNSVIQAISGDRDEAGNIGLAFAIPINQVRRVAHDIISTGTAHRTVFGANVVDVEGAGGARISSISAGGPASDAGLKVGDVVETLDDHPLAAALELVALVRSRPAGAVVAVRYQRGGQPHTVSVTLTAGDK